MKPKVLVVDDDNAMRNMLSTLLDNNGYLVDEADCFVAACKLADSDDYDIILTDKNYPGINNNAEGGIDLINYIRTKCLSAELIMITGHPSLETAIRVIKLGAFDYVQKPFSTIVLLDKLNRLIEYRQFINPNTMCELYRNTRQAVFTLIEERSHITDVSLSSQLVDININMDNIISVFKKYEQIVLSLRESLSRIAIMSEELLVDIPNNNTEHLLYEIRCIASTNI